MTTETAPKPKTPSRAPAPTTGMGTLFAHLVRRAMTDRAPDETPGVPVKELVALTGKPHAYVSAQLCMLRKRGLVSAVLLGRWLPTDHGVAAARAVYGPNLEALG